MTIKPNALSDRNMIKRWQRLFKGTPLTQRFLQQEPLDPGELACVQTLIDMWRLRLSRISWFMRVLNESIARQANKADHCTGRFYSLPSMTLPLRAA